MNILFLFIAFFLIGVAIYYCDLLMLRMSGKSKKTSPEKRKGPLVVGRFFRRRLLVAVIIVTAEIILSFWFGQADLQWDLVYGMVELVGLMFGFYGASWFLRTAPKRLNEALDYAERVESGERDIAEDLKNTMKKVNVTAKISADKGPDKKSEEKKISPVADDSEKRDITKITSKDLDSSIDEFRKK